MKIPQFEGILTVITTPFDKKGAIDFGVLEKHIEFLISAGVHAVMPGGSTGEYYAQSVEERREVLSFVASKVKKRVPIYAGTNSARPSETIELLLFAAKQGGPRGAFPQHGG
jgi:4-hydroxy-tetrahydrodipicolinate synthase